MIRTNNDRRILQQLMTSGRIVTVTMAVCCLMYGFAVLMIGQGLFPQGAHGSLVRDEQGLVVGSALLAQGFSRPEYFWPRPSAVGYNASAAGGSNWSPTNPELGGRGQAIAVKMGADRGHLLPADLATASGSGLDPHITLAAACFQAERVAAARGLSTGAVLGLLEKQTLRPGGALTPEPLVNVLLANLALNRLGKSDER